VSYLRELLEPLRQYLDDPAVENIHLNSSGSVTVVRQSGPEELATASLPAGFVGAFLRAAATSNDTSITPSAPLLEAAISPWNLRIAGAIPPVTDAPCCVLRRPPEHTYTFQDLIDKHQLLSQSRGEVLYRAFLSGRTVLIAGSTNSGKTTLARAMLNRLLCERPNERIIAIEEGASELRLAGRDCQSFIAHGSMTVRDLARFALRLNIGRLVLGELRGPETANFHSLLNTGHGGALSTLHANSALEIVHRYEDLLREAGLDPQPDRVAAALDVLVYIRRDPDTGDRRVTELMQLGIEGRQFVTQPLQGDAR